MLLLLHWCNYPVLWEGRRSSRVERSEKYESEKTTADGPWGGWVGIPRQMKIEVGVAKSSGLPAASAEMFSFA